MCSTMASPTLRTAERPKMITPRPSAGSLPGAGLIGVKLEDDAFTSGTLTSMPSVRHSAR